jgi:hypothetical protein
LADAGFFGGLVLLYLSVQELYPVPIVCFDGGLSDEQKRWAAEHMPLCFIWPMPDTEEVATVRRTLHGASENKTEEWLLWVCPFLISASPFQRTLWLDTDLIVLRNLGELFQKIENGPVFTSENHDPDRTANHPELYSYLPIEGKDETRSPLVNGGVTGWDLDRDRELLAMYRKPVLAAARDERIRSAIRWHDQGSLIWAIQKTGMERFVIDGRTWNICARHTATPDKDYDLNDDLFDELRRDYPQANLVHWNGFARERKLCCRVGDPVRLSNRISHRFPGVPRAGGRPNGSPRIHLISYVGCKAHPWLIDQFLEHYSRLGVDSMLIILHGAEDDPRMTIARDILARHGVTPAFEAREYSAPLKHRRSCGLMDDYCRSEDWVLHADVDELQVYPDCLPDLLESCDDRGYRFVKGRFVDRIAADGRLVPIESGSPLWDQFPVAASVTREIPGGWVHKICAMRGDLRPGDGGSHGLDYDVDGFRKFATAHRDPRGLPGYMEIHHFKWDETLLQRTIEKLEGYGGDRDSEEGPYWEYERLLAHLAQNDRLQVSDARRVGTPDLHYVRDGAAVPAEDP